MDPLGFDSGDYNLYRYVENNPVNFTDPTGLLLDTVLDVGFVIYDIYVLVDHLIEGCGDIDEDLLALGLDVGGALIPFATGGGLAVRAATKVDDIGDAARLLNKVDETGDVRRLYHGTSSIFENLIRQAIDLSKGRLNLDFNPSGKRGFYVTEIYQQAEEWAQRLAHRHGGEPAILEFIIPLDEIQTLNGKVFVDAAGEWSEFVLQGRRGKLEHIFDFVEGPMLRNPRAATGGKRLPEAIGHQLAIFTEEAAELFQRHLSP